MDTIGYYTVATSHDHNHNLAELQSFGEPKVLARNSFCSLFSGFSSTSARYMYLGAWTVYTPETACSGSNQCHFNPKTRFSHSSEKTYLNRIKHAFNSENLCTMSDQSSLNEPSQIFTWI